MEISIRKFIELWEQRYTEVHGKTEEQKQSRRLEKLSKEIRQLHTLRDQTRPSDDVLFYDDVDEFLANTTTTRAANYTSSTKRIIKHSVAAATKEAVTKTKNIHKWFQPIKEGGLARIQKWRRNKLVHDAYSKKRKRKAQTTVEPIKYMQPSLLGYISSQQDME